MFGGLDIKSVASPERPKPEEPTATSADASASSAPAATSSSPSTSAFGFLNSLGPAETATPSASAFSFLSSDNGAAAASQAAAPAAAADPGGAATASAFSFLTPSESSSAEATKNGTTASDAPSTGFGFLQTTTSTAAVDISSPTTAANGTTSGPSTTNDEPLPPPSPPSAATSEDLLSSPSTSSVTPVFGSGVVFGGAVQQAAGNKLIKKRTRTNKIGQGVPVAALAAATTSLPAPASLGIPESQSSGLLKSTSKSDILTAAEQATLRAEQFIHNQSQAAALAGSAAYNNSEDDDDDDDDERNRSIRSVPSEDSVLQKAKAAALEAQEKIMADTSSSSSNKYFGGRIGGLFRPRTSETGATSMANSSHGSINNGSHHLKSSGSTSSMETTSRPSTVALPRTALPPSQRRPSQQNDDAAKELPGSGTMEFVPPPLPEFDRAISAPVNLQPMSAPQTPDPYGTIMPSAATAARPGRKKLKTPTDRFHDMLQEFRDKVVAYMDQITRLRQTRAGLLEERFVTLAKQRLAFQQIEAAQAQQQLAAEQEDFDLAEQLQHVIQGHEREDRELATVKDNIARAIEQVDEQRKLVIDAVTLEFSRIQQRLKEFEKEQDTLECSHAAESVAKFTLVAKQLSAEQERLNHDLKHLERDAKLVAEERKELESAISEQTTDIETMRDDAKSKLKTVQDEIEELRRQLAAKQQIAAQLRTEAAGHEEAILKVRVKFARQLTRVQRKEMSVKDAREEWEQEKQSFDRNKEEHDRNMTEHSEQLLAQERLLTSLTNEMELAETFGEIIAKEIGVGFLPSDDDEDNGDLAQMHTEVVKCEAAVSEAKTVFKATSATLSNMEVEIATLEKRIPILEETKKQCATTRDFKGAGVASKEIKEAMSRVNECREAIEEVRHRKASAEANLTSLEEDLTAKSLIAQEHEREANLAVMNRLADKMKRLMATKNKVCEDAEKLSVKGVGAYVLHSQIMALRSEGQALGEKYGGWSERMKEIGWTNDADGSDSKEAELVAELSEKGAGTGYEMVDGEVEINVTKPLPLESLEEKQARYRALASRLSDVESGIESAAEAEDFERAAEMQEELDKLLVELEGLDLTDEEMEAALANEQLETVADLTQRQEGLEESLPVEDSHDDDAATEQESCDVIGASSVATEEEVDELEAPVQAEDPPEIANVDDDDNSAGLETDETFEESSAKQPVRDEQEEHENVTGNEIDENASGSAELEPVPSATESSPTTGEDAMGYTEADDLDEDI